MIGPWTAKAIHDTVAAIVRKPEYAIPLRRSLLGRAFSYLFERIAELFALFHGSRDLRLAAIAGAALIVLAIIGRIVVASRLDTLTARGRRASSFGGGSRRDFWNLSHELAAAGDHLAASHALYAAVVDDLARGGAITFHASKTSGDYALELRRRGLPGFENFRAFARQLDRVVYGAVTVTAGDYDQLASLAQRVAPRPVAA